MKPSFYDQGEGEFLQPVFICPVCFEKSGANFHMELEGGSVGPEDGTFTPPDTVSCGNCGYRESIEQDWALVVVLAQGLKVRGKVGIGGL